MIAPPVTGLSGAARLNPNASEAHQANLRSEIPIPYLPEMAEHGVFVGEAPLDAPKGAPILRELETTRMSTPTGDFLSVLYHHTGVMSVGAHDVHGRRIGSARPWL